MIIFCKDSEVDSEFCTAVVLNRWVVSLSQINNYLMKQKETLLEAKDVGLVSTLVIKKNTTTNFNNELFSSLKHVHLKYQTFFLTPLLL